MSNKPPLSEQENIALAEGIRQADNADFASNEDVASFFKKGTYTRNHSKCRF